MILLSILGCLLLQKSLAEWQQWRSRRSLSGFCLVAPPPVPRLSPTNLQVSSVQCIFRGGGEASSHSGDAYLGLADCTVFSITLIRRFPFKNWEAEGAGGGGRRGSGRTIPMLLHWHHHLASMATVLKCSTTLKERFTEACTAGPLL